MRLPFLLSFFFLFFLSAAAAQGSLPRGANPRDASLYQRPDQKFVCRSHSGRSDSLEDSAILDIAAVNDDYCDCPDGSDEPGTSACHRGKFYCTNEGSVPQSIPSTLVDDGVCDCCDKSDELEGSTICPTRSCQDEGKQFAQILAGHLSRELQGQHLARKSAQQAEIMAKEIAEALARKDEEARPLQQQLRSTLQELEEVDKLRMAMKDKKPAPASAATDAAKSEDGSQRLQVKCAYTDPAAKHFGRAEVAFAINSSCIADERCALACSLLCQGSQQYRPVCTVLLPDGATWQNFRFDPDGVPREEYFRKVRQYGPDVLLEVQDHGMAYMVPPLPGQSSTPELDTQRLRLRQAVGKTRIDMAPVMQEQRELSRKSGLLEALVGDEAVAPYADLLGKCLSLGQDQYVATTAVREQWTHFYYSICFFENVTQHEVKKAPDAAAAYDESGAHHESQEAAEQGEAMLLGRPIAFVHQMAEVSPRDFGIESPLFFDVEGAQHLFLFAAGAPCAGGRIQRSVAVQFRCGPKPELLRVTEVRMCCYVAEVAHPAPCQASSWPDSLPMLAMSTAEEHSNAPAAEAEAVLARRLETWMQTAADALLVVDGPARWTDVIGNAQDARKYLQDTLERSSKPPLVTFAGLTQLLSFTSSLLSVPLWRAWAALPEAVKSKMAGPLESLYMTTLKDERVAILITTLSEAIARSWSHSADMLQEMELLPAMVRYLQEILVQVESSKPFHGRRTIPSDPWDLLALVCHLFCFYCIVVYLVLRALRIACRCCCYFCCCRCCCQRKSAQSSRGGSSKSG
mmetsp:Transcript_46884/g.111611  ORF Transcript_46884/g.111611 Transcript_46884/m.111611 type:complete len:800 (+) Transcript_46884:189-2588(+)